MNVAEELLGVLRASGKDFMTLNAVRDKISSQLRGSLGIKDKRLAASSLKKILEPHLDEKLAIRQNSHFTYLVAVGDLRATQIGRASCRERV